MLGHTLLSGQKIVIKIDSKMPYIEVNTKGDATGEADEIARLRAEDCFEPPL